MHATTELHESPRTLDQCREHVGRERVDGEDACMPLRLGDRPFVDDMPALWMTASIRPMAFTWAAMLLVSAALPRSPMITPAERDASSSSAAARSRDRACSTTSWPSSMSV